ncbi:response regulator [Pseudomonas putida]|uniref:MHYT domain-containing protein n=1 Tax=Pseudomonas putida TaxID=303 RepID=UPI0018AB71B6|nr:MHYT domain-containing protein [Pseudomonas putida]MBF8670254.1 response regulator [Pseudomonas putida]MBF8713128.1 response regulator [Pseudomonas putida]
MEVISDFFVNGSHSTAVVDGSYNLGLVLLSLFVSIFSSTMALQSAQIARRTKSPLYRQTAIGTGAIALGGGIWTMHFIGMLAFELPTHVHYATSITLLSLAPACIASWFALHRLGQDHVSTWQLVLSGTIVGTGVGAMHYTGMAAMQTPLQMRYDPLIFSLSIVVAVSFATLALWVRYGVQRTKLSRLKRFYLSGCVMGLAIAGMHYTGMAAVRFMGEPDVASNSLLINATFASIGLSSFTITVTVMVAAVNGLIRSRELYLEVDESRSRLRAILDNAVDGIITINSCGSIRGFNAAAERLFGWRAEEIIGENISLLMPDPGQPGCGDCVFEYLASGQPKTIGTGCEVKGLRKNGERIPVRIALGRVELPGDLLFVGFVSDMSERHALEASLRDTAERAEQATAAKSSFLANMSHEIRTPMNSIIGFSELLLQSDLTAVQRNQLSNIRQSSRTLLHLINDILDTTKMEKGQLELERTVFSLRELALQIESSLRLSAQAKQLTLTTLYPVDMPEYFQGDPLRLLQILTNLIGNAIKFTERGSVDVEFGYINNVVHVRVRDTGIGMSPKQVASIFSPFTQADASISRRFGGTGLGTTIARQLAELMNGRIDVESRLGHGSTFHVWLPLPVAEAPIESPAEPSPTCYLPALHILIADDVPQNLELLSLVLEANGHTVTMARDGAEALEKYKNDHFDIALMDVHMPIIDGLQATKLIRQHERDTGRTSMPVIALTASVMAEDRRAALQAGMNGFAIKPLDTSRLFVQMAVVLGIPCKTEAVRLTGAAVENKAVVIDWTRGVALWGSEQRLASAIERLLDTALEKYPFLCPAINDIDWESALNSLHNLRGVAGNLALPEVAQLVGIIEVLVKEGQHAAARDCLPSLRFNLDAVRKELPVPRPLATNTPTSMPGPLVLSMRQLIETLAHNELDEEILEQVCNGLEDSKNPVEARALRAAADAFEFQQARALLQKLIKDHHHPLQAAQ